MKTKIRRIISFVMLIVLILVLGTGVAGAVAKANLAKKYPAPGQLVDVGGYKMHINCTGQGSPTVILEAGLGEVVVAGESDLDPVLPHDHEAGAVREGEGLVLPAEEPLPSFLGARRVDPVPQEPRAAVDLVPPALGGREAQPDAEQGQGLVHHVVRGQEDTAVLEPGITSVPRDRVRWVGGVGQHHPASGVDEERFHRRGLP